VPKGSKLAQEAQALANLKGGGKAGGRSRKNSKVTTYVEKKPSGAATQGAKGQAAAGEGGAKPKSMY